MKRTLLFTRSLALVAFIVLMMMPGRGWGQTSIPNTTPVVQNFDGMAATTTLPTNWRMHQNAAPTYASGTATLTGQTHEKKAIIGFV